MPQTPEYSNKVNTAIEATQAKNGMTSKNVNNLQKLLKYYPENKNLKVDGLYGGNTIKAVNSFYEQRKVERLSEMHGEKYIMQSEMQGMKESKKGSAKEY